jgi:deazaflavin-dependent oxidoreductase (nitroreductase family)
MGAMADNPDAAGRRKPPALLLTVFTPLADRLAGQPWFPIWARLYHRGRTSGKDYQIPVAVLVSPDSFVIALPYGTKTNWVLNVQAAGGCTIHWKGRDYPVTEPQLVDRDTALAAANPLERLVLRRVNFPGYLQLRRAA